MLFSMTGFGQGEVSDRASRVTVEIRTVNHRFLDFSIKMPQALAHRERDVKEIIREKISRGRISVAVVTETEEPDVELKINVPLMERYLTELREFADRHSLKSDVDINTLATMPEVFIRLPRDSGSDELWTLVRKGLKQALAACTTMRAEEGRALEGDIRARIAKIERVMKKVEKLAPKVVAKHSAAFKSRLEKLMEGSQVDRERWLTEAVILADRLDFTEEVIRLNSHLAQIGSCLEKGGAVSKKLTYLLQEVHREATTIGSKASDAEVIECVVSIKEESEKLREQVQNLE